jgi:hypothetical protein
LRWEGDDGARCVVLSPQHLVVVVECGDDSGGSGQSAVEFGDLLLGCGQLSAEIMHRDLGLTVRPDATLKQLATQALSDRDREMKAFVVACLSALIADPDGFLEQLNEHWPAAKPRGRPRKATSAMADSDETGEPPRTDR